jgi:hypothetical protein
MAKDSCYVTVSSNYTATVFEPDALDSYLSQALYPMNIDNNFGRIVSIGDDWSKEDLDLLKAKIENWIKTDKRLSPSKCCTDHTNKWEKALWYPRVHRIFVGDWLSVDRNQALRDAEVLAVIGNEAFIQYEMPNGAIYHNVIDLVMNCRAFSGSAMVDGKWKQCYRAISPNNIPKKWRDALSGSGNLGQVIG